MSICPSRSTPCARWKKTARCAPSWRAKSSPTTRRASTASRALSLDRLFIQPGVIHAAAPPAVDIVPRGGEALDVLAHGIKARRIADVNFRHVVEMLVEDLFEQRPALGSIELLLRLVEQRLDFLVAVAG